VLARIDNAVERMAWLPAVVYRGGLDGGATREELKRALAARATALRTRVEAAPPPPPAEAERRLLPAEKLLLTLIVEGSGDLTAALLELHEADLGPLRSAPILTAARDRAAAGNAVSRSALDEALGDEDRRLLNEIAVQGTPTEGVTASECVRELRCVPLKARMAEIQKDLARATGADQEALLAEKLQLKRQMASL